MTFILKKIDLYDYPSSLNASKHFLAFPPRVRPMRSMVNKHYHVLPFMTTEIEMFSDELFDFLGLSQWQIGGYFRGVSLVILVVDRWLFQWCIGGYFSGVSVVTESTADITCSPNVLFSLQQTLQLMSQMQLSVFTQNFVVATRDRASKYVCVNLVHAQKAYIIVLKPSFGNQFPSLAFTIIFQFLKRLNEFRWLFL